MSDDSKTPADTAASGGDIEPVATPTKCKGCPLCPQPTGHTEIVDLRNTIQSQKRTISVLKKEIDKRADYWQVGGACMIAIGCFMIVDSFFVEARVKSAVQQAFTNGFEAGQDAAIESAAGSP